MMDKCADENLMADICNRIKLTKNLDPDCPTVQSIQEGIKFIISKTQENCQLQRVFKTQWHPSKGEVLHSYLHNKIKPGIGKIGSVFVSPPY
jgi:translation elongation factor EF-Ts